MPLALMTSIKSAEAFERNSLMERHERTPSHGLQASIGRGH